MRHSALILRALVVGSLYTAQVSVGHADSSALREVATFSASAVEQTFQVDLQPQARCSFGDYDVILNDLRQANGQLGLQLSMESLSGDKKSVFYGRPRKDKTAESNVGTYEVTIPSTELSGVYGIFLCSVTQEDAERVPCSQQALMPFDEMAAPYKVDSGGIAGGSHSSEPYRAPIDTKAKLYFAQFAAVSNKSLAIFLDAPAESSATQLAAFGVPAAQMSAFLGRAKPFSDTLGSLALTANDARLQMVLPYFSEKKCIGN